MCENHEPTLESHKTEQTKDSIFNRLEQPMDYPHFDDDYDSECKCLVGSRESIDLRARLDT